VETLKASDKKKLKQISHGMQPVIMLGKNGLTDAVVKALKIELENHEVVKVRFQKFQDEKNDMIEGLASMTESTIIKIIGNVAVLYKKSSDPEKNIL